MLITFYFVFTILLCNPFKIEIELIRCRSKFFVKSTLVKIRTDKFAFAHTFVKKSFKKPVKQPHQGKCKFAILLIEGGNNQKKPRMCAKYIGTKKVDQFVEITKTTKSVALEYLQIYDGNVQLAIDDFYLDIKLKSIFAKSQTRHHDKNRKISISKLVCRCMRRTLSKCVRCACGCGRKSAHTKGLIIINSLIVRKYSPRYFQLC